jgi:PhnB protein
MQAVVPYLTVSSADQAIAYYKKAFEAKENSRQAGEDGKVMHADVSIYGGTIFVMDEFPNMGALGPKAGASSPVGMVIQFSKPAEVDRVYAQAIAAGGKKGQDPHDAFWGARFAFLTDPFGHSWMLNAALPQK